MNTYKVLTWIL